MSSLEMEPWSSGRVASDLNHKAISLALCQILEMGVVLSSSALSDLLLTLLLLLRAWEQRK